jgi:ABC-2 type transport system permease protein
MLVPLSRLPGWLAGVARALPSGALADALHGALAGGPVPGRAWLVLALWAVAGPVAAASTFRWE